MLSVDEGYIKLQDKSLQRFKQNFHVLVKLEEISRFVIFEYMCIWVEEEEEYKNNKSALR